MENLIFIAFITGLTAGGLSCFAVQGGLLSGSIAQQVEARLRAKGAQPAMQKGRSGVNLAPQAGMIQPILLFMVAKLVAYTALGFVLGLLGSMFTFSPFMMGLIQLLVAIFLIGNALRMFNVHPIFRYFSFEPPSQVTRYVRRVSKHGARWVTPLFLGALTVLLPCGVTQSIMAVAVGTASPWLGAVIMFAFILGTGPTFVAIAWVATNLGGMFQKYFYNVVTMMVLALGLYTLNGGLTLMGSPISASKLQRTLQGQQAAPAQAAPDPATFSPLPAAGGAGAPLGVAPAAPSSASNVAQILVENSGYSPETLVLPANQDIELHLVTNNTHSCSRAFVIPALGIQEILPETGEKVVTIPAQASGTSIDFMCSMGMFTGVVQFK